MAKKTTVSKDYANIVNAVANFKGSKAELRKFVLENNKGKNASDKSRIGMDMAVKLWRKNQPSAKAKKRDIQVANQSKVVIPTTPTETKYYYGKRDYSGTSDKYITESGEMGVESPLMRKRGYKMPGFGKRK